MARWVTYMLHCVGGSFYAGSTTDLARRLQEHASGRGGAYTRSHRPVTLAWSQGARDRSTAQRREARIKTLGREAKAELARSRRRLP